MADYSRKSPGRRLLRRDGYDGARIKQADVNLLAYPLKFITDKEQIRRDLEYYAAKVPEKNTPAMTESIFALLYSRLGDADKAGHYFTRSYRANMLPPFGVVSECKGGKNPYFLTGAGGVLQALLFGFGGYDITDGGLRQIPTVLPSWCRSIDIRRPDASPVRPAPSADRQTDRRTNGNGTENPAGRRLNVGRRVSSEGEGMNSVTV